MRLFIRSTFFFLSLFVIFSINAENIFLIKCSIPSGWKKEISSNKFISRSPDNIVEIIIDSLNYPDYSIKKDFDNIIAEGQKSIINNVKNFKEDKSKEAGGQLKSGLLYYQLYGKSKLNGKEADTNAFIVFTKPNPVVFILSFTQHGDKYAAEINQIINSIEVAK